jgi:hypothetical protein
MEVEGQLWQRQPKLANVFCSCLRWEAAEERHVLVTSGVIDGNARCIAGSDAYVI